MEARSLPIDSNSLGVHYQHGDVAFTRIVRKTVTVNADDISRFCLSLVLPLAK